VILTQTQPGTSATGSTMDSQSGADLSVIGHLIQFGGGSVQGRIEQGPDFTQRIERAAVMPFSLAPT
jgi:hypothetical protein